MGALLWVKVPPRADHSERSEAQLRKGAKQGERANNREALVVKAKWRKSGGCAVKECVLTWGGLASCLKGRRGNAERGVSRGHSSFFFFQERRAERVGVFDSLTMNRVRHQIPASAGRVAVAVAVKLVVALAAVKPPFYVPARCTLLPWIR